MERNSRRELSGAFNETNVDVNIPLYWNFKVTQLMSKSKRVTIMIDDDLDKNLRTEQAKRIQQESSSYSYSKVLNDTLRKVLK